MGWEFLFVYSVGAASNQSNLCFSTFKTSMPVFTEDTFPSFRFPSPFPPGILGPLADARVSGSSLEGHGKFHLSLTIKIKNKVGLFNFPSQQKLPCHKCHRKKWAAEEYWLGTAEHISHINYHMMLSEVQSMSSMDQLVADVHREWTAVASSPIIATLSTELQQS